MQKIKYLDNVIYPAVLMSLGAIYFSHAPTTVQSGDSGELVAAAHKLLVPHPPGYPLWIWLNHLWLKFFSIGSIFQSASILNSIICLGALFFLGAVIPSQPTRLLAVIALGLSPIFWQYAEIPEVFALNTILSLAVVYTAISRKTLGASKIPISAAFMPIIFSLGIAHHHTIIFLLPLVLYSCWIHKKQKILYASIALGFIICCSLYLSLQFLNPDFIYSWNSLDSTEAIWNHFLRKDYGTFTLQAQHQNSDSSSILFFYIKHLLISTWPLLFTSTTAVFISIQRRKKIIWEHNWTAILACIVLYSLVFIPMTHTLPTNFMAEVLERFFILPISLIFLLLGLFLAKNDDLLFKFSLFKYALTVIVGISSFALYSKSRNFSKNTIIEDYAYNLLQNAGTFKHPLLVIDGDTELFATRYLQIVENIQPDILVGAKHLFKIGWFILKAKRFAPELSLDYDRITQNKILLVVEDFIWPNADKFSIITDVDEYPTDQLKISVLPIGFLLQKGTGLEVLPTGYEFRMHTDASMIDTALTDFSYFRSILTKYTYFYTLQGIQSARYGDPQKSIDFFEQALRIAPFTIPPMENLCKIKKELNAVDSRCNNIESQRKNFDYYKFNDKRGT